MAAFPGGTTHCCLQQTANPLSAARALKTKAVLITPTHFSCSQVCSLCY